MKYLGAIIGVVLLLLLGVSFPFSLLIVGVTWLVVYMVAKSNTVDGQSQNEYKAPDKKEITNPTEFPQPPAWVKKEEPLDQSVTPTSRIHEEYYSENNKDNYKVSAYAYHNGAGTYNGSATPKSEVIVFSQRSEVSDIADKQYIASIVQSIADYTKIGKEHNVFPATISDDVKTAVGNVIYMLIEHAASDETLIEVMPKPDERSLTIERLKSLIANIMSGDADKDDICEEYENRISDDSIIDVTGEYYSIESVPQTKSIISSGEVPYWGREYIYSTRSLDYASSKIKHFYKKYKEAFLSGIYYDLEGNENHAFTLMFDLLQEHDKHPNLTQLTNQIRALIEHCPDTKYYAERELIQRAKTSTKRRAQCTDGETSLEDIMELFPDSHEWTFIDKYAEKLNLTTEEITIFDFISRHQSLYYIGIDFMLIKVVDLFRMVLHNLELKFQEENKTLKEELTRIAKVMSLRVYYYGEEKDGTRHKINSIYDSIFRLCSNKLHQKYGFGYSDMDIYYSVGDENRKILVADLMPLVRSVLKESLGSWPELSDDEEIVVNKHYNTRWRPKFQEITESYNNDLSYFAEATNRLVTQNSKNYGVGYLLFDASKFLVGKDNIAALKMYLRYVDAYRKFSSDTEKPLPKYICKKLFKKQEHQDEFEQIVLQYKCDKDQIKAYEAIDQLFLPKRKKLQLDQNEISKIAEQHSETVLLLNEVMEEGEVAIADTKPKQDITVPNSDTTTSDLQTNALLDSLHLELLDIFAENNHSLAKARVEDFAKSKGLMANRLIDKINELCYETLDDVLIEDENDKWTIMEEYLKKIVA